MIFGWFVFMNNIEYGIAPKGTAKGWPMMSSRAYYEIGGVSPRALAVNWGLALVVSVVGAVGARTIYRIGMSRLFGLKKEGGASDSDQP